MKRHGKLVWIAILLLFSLAAGRLYVRHLAFGYGRNLAKAYAVVGRYGFADITELHQFLAEPEMAGSLKRVGKLSFLGGHYNERLSELQAGMIYCCEQISLPEQQRFATPLHLSYLPLQSSDRSNDGINSAINQLLGAYLSQLSFANQGD